MANDRKQHPPNTRDSDLRLPPADENTERLVLGAALIDEPSVEAVAALDSACFSTEALRRIHARIADLHERGVPCDRVTVANELRKLGQLESVGGLAVIVDLEKGLPKIENLETYLQILREFAGRRRLIALGAKVMEDAYRGEQSPLEIAAGTQAEWQEIESSSGQNEDGGQTALEVIENFHGGLEAFLDPTKRHKGLPTGFTKLDEMTSGMMGGDIIVIGAATSQGKTALALNIASHLCLHPRQRRQVAFFSLEMSAESILTRMACAHGHVDQLKFRAGYLNQEERKRLHTALFEITESNFRIYDQAGITAPEIMQRARALHNKDGLHLILIDYLQLVGSHRNSENRNQEISQMSRQFKLLAGELGIPVVLLSQLSRAGAKRSDNRPMLSDLRDSGSIEQDASVVLMIYREEVYKRDREDLRGAAELIVGKNRNGPIGVVPLRFLHQFTRFENRAEDIPE